MLFSVFCLCSGLMRLSKYQVLAHMEAHMRHIIVLYTSMHMLLRFLLLQTRPHGYTTLFNEI